MRPLTIVKQLPVRMTGEEKALKSEQLVAALAKIADLEEEKKNATSSIAQSIKEEKKRGGELAHELRTGEEIRPIECVEMMRFEQDMVEVVRNDTGEVVERRAMDPRDRQAHMNLGDFDAARERKRRAEKPAKGKLTLLDGQPSETKQDDSEDGKGPEETH